MNQKYLNMRSEEIEKKIIERCLLELKENSLTLSVNHPMEKLLTDESIADSSNLTKFSHNPYRIIIKAVSEVMAEELYKVVPRKKK